MAAELGLIGLAIASIDHIQITVEYQLALPVELIEFKGKLKNKAVHLNWTTASEDNNQGFEIEHSTNAGDWKTIAFIKGEGTSTTINRYDYVHDNPQQGSNYYRLKQMDFNGGFQYSEIINIDVEKQIKVQAHPNPTNGKLKFTGIIFQNATLRIIDCTGKVVKKQVLQSQDLDISDLPDGLYFLSIINEKQAFEMKIIKR